MILGEDPRAPHTSARKMHPKVRRAIAKRISPQVSDVCQYFNFSARKVGAAAVGPNDRLLFRPHIIRYMSSGVERQTMKKLIDVFFMEDRYRTHPCPWKAFVTENVQQYLMQKISAEVRTLDPALQWVLNDFDRSGLDLFWPPEDDSQVRNIFLGFPHVVFRYPEFVVDLLERYPLPEVRQVLTEVDDLILKVLANGRELQLKSALLDRGVPLPRGIASQTTLRTKAPTLAIAIAKSQQ